MFSLKFPKAEISIWSERYSFASEPEAENIVQSARGQQFLTLAQFERFCYWKSPRIHSRCGSNDADYVEKITHIALTTPHERLRIEILTLLHGVGWPMASVILHWCHPDPYPLLDFRALWSLGFDKPPRYKFEFWWAYTQFCRQLALEANVSMRTLDRALWQYSKEHQ